MAGTRKARVPMAEQIRLINECRQSGMTDADWCHENDIAVSTFYNWVSRCRKAAADQIPPPNYANVKHFFTLLGKMFFTSYGKEFFIYHGKQIFTSQGKHLFTRYGKQTLSSAQYKCL